MTYAKDLKVKATYKQKRESNSTTEKKTKKENGNCSPPPLFSCHPQSVSGCAISGSASETVATVTNLKVDYIDQLGEDIVLQSKEKAAAALMVKAVNHKFERPLKHAPFRGSNYAVVVIF